MRTSVSEFERHKPRKTRKEIKRLIDKYQDVMMNVEIMEEEDCIKVEMAADFVKELTGVMKVFENGE
jgi:hypothetical protein